MRVSCIQFNPQNIVQENLSSALKLISQAAKSGAEVVVLPEVFSFMGEESQRKNTKDKIGTGVFAELQNAARELKINLIAGSHSEEIPNEKDKVFNTSVTYNKEGELISIYRKLHLFNLFDNQKKPLYLESNTYNEGEPPKGYHLNCNQEEWHALNIICYDIRFPEVVRSNMTKTSMPYDILFVPAAFTWQTGKDHWEILLRARAIENQCFVVACNQTGYFHQGQKRNYGNSMIIDPWGNVLGRLGEESGILTVDINKKSIKETRDRLPALSDRKIF